MNDLSIYSLVMMFLCGSALLILLVLWIVEANDDSE